MSPDICSVAKTPLALPSFLSYFLLCASVLFGESGSDGIVHLIVESRSASRAILQEILIALHNPPAVAARRFEQLQQIRNSQEFPDLLIRVHERKLTATCPGRDIKPCDCPEPRAVNQGN